MKLTKAEVQLVRWAAGVAIASERELIECHRVGFDPRTQKRIIPPDFRPIVAQCRRTINRLQWLIEKLEPSSKPKGKPREF